MYIGYSLVLIYYLKYWQAIKSYSAYLSQAEIKRNDRKVSSIHRFSGWGENRILASLGQTFDCIPILHPDTLFLEYIAWLAQIQRFLSASHMWITHHVPSTPKRLHFQYSDSHSTIYILRSLINNISHNFHCHPCRNKYTFNAQTRILQ